MFTFGAPFIWIEVNNDQTRLITATWPKFPFSHDWSLPERAYTHPWLVSHWKGVHTPLTGLSLKGRTHTPDWSLPERAYTHPWLVSPERAYTHPWLGLSWKGVHAPLTGLSWKGVHAPLTGISLKGRTRTLTGLSLKGRTRTPAGQSSGIYIISSPMCVKWTRDKYPNKI